jgi:hypothetical protein
VGWAPHTFAEPRTSLLVQAKIGVGDAIAHHHGPEGSIAKTGKAAIWLLPFRPNEVVPNNGGMTASTAHAGPFRPLLLQASADGAALSIIASSVYRSGANAPAGIEI